jgi:hypothetical protein
VSPHDTCPHRKSSPTPFLQSAPRKLRTSPQELASPEDGPREETHGLAGPQLLPAPSQLPRQPELEPAMDAISTWHELRSGRTRRCWRPPHKVWRGGGGSRPVSAVEGSSKRRRLRGGGSVRRARSATMDRIRPPLPEFEPELMRAAPPPDPRQRGREWGRAPPFATYPCRGGPSSRPPEGGRRGAPGRREEARGGWPRARCRR